MSGIPTFMPPFSSGLSIDDKLAEVSFEYTSEDHVEQLLRMSRARPAKLVRLWAWLGIGAVALVVLIAVSHERDPFIVPLGLGFAIGAMIPSMLQLAVRRDLQHRQ